MVQGVSAMTHRGTSTGEEWAATVQTGSCTPGSEACLKGPVSLWWKLLSPGTWKAQDTRGGHRALLGCRGLEQSLRSLAGLSRVAVVGAGGPEGRGPGGPPSSGLSTG